MLNKKTHTENKTVLINMWRSKSKPYWFCTRPNQTFILHFATTPTKIYKPRAPDQTFGVRNQNLWPKPDKPYNPPTTQSGGINVDPYINLVKFQLGVVYVRRHITPLGAGELVKEIMPERLGF